MPKYLSSLSLLTLLTLPALWAHPLHAETEFPAQLAGHVVLPALSFVPPPADAPNDFAISGKFATSPTRLPAGAQVEGKSNGRPTGVKLPFTGQAIQGHSGIKHMPDGSFWVLTDNGFGSKANSPDSSLMLNHYRFAWKKNQVERLETIFLRDPDHIVPFRLLHEGTTARYLTGSDFDTEGFQIINQQFWIGDEFGPYILKTDMTGKVLGFFETSVDGKPLKSPDHYSVTTPNPDGVSSARLGRSRGFEGFAASPDGRFIYGLLEGPLWDEATKAYEKINGATSLRLLEFSVADEKWTGRQWRYVLEPGATAIGDFNMIDDKTALVIERDNGEGTLDLACPKETKKPDCFPDTAKFKHVVKIAFGAENLGQNVTKIGYIDLMKIEDPQKLAVKPLTQGLFTFPFFTIENVDVVDQAHIVVGNDNNLPFSSSRNPNMADDNEFILLKVPELLQAQP